MRSSITTRNRRGTWARALCGGALLLGALSCKSSVQPTAYVGDGVYEGEPPMCLQYKKASMPGPYQRSLVVHFNNTCDYGFECYIYNDATETEQRMVIFGEQKASILVAAQSDATSFDIELDCQWKP